MDPLFILRGLSFFKTIENLSITIKTGVDTIDFCYSEFESYLDSDEQTDAEAFMVPNFTWLESLNDLKSFSMKGEGYHFDYTGLKDFSDKLPEACHVEVDPKMLPSKYQCSHCGAKSHKGTYFGRYSDMEFFDVFSSYYELNKFIEARDEVTDMASNGDIYDGEVVAYAKGSDFEAEVKCSSCEEPMAVTLKQDLGDFADKVDRVLPYQKPTLRGPAVNSTPQEKTKGSSLIKEHSCNICDSSLYIRAVKSISVQETGKESGEVTLDAESIPNTEHMEFSGGDASYSNETGVDSPPVYSINCGNIESPCWYMDYLMGETLEDIISCAEQTEATPLAWLPACRKKH
jgi:hypothetical protein